MKGLEPLRFAAPDPKSGSATNYDTSALISAAKVLKISFNTFFYGKKCINLVHNQKKQGFMRRSISVLCFLACIPCFILCRTKTHKNEGVPTLIWSTQAVFKTPESVIFNTAENEIYVANINGKPSEKDGNGFISKLTSTGEVQSLHWVDGLNGPKGMGIFGNLLYVADIDRVAVIDIAKGQIIRMYEVPGSVFLNDITVTNEGVVYVSDSEAATIYSIKQEKVEKVTNGPTLEGVNGLWAENGYLLAGTKKNIQKVNYQTGEPSLFIDNTGSIDGLVPSGSIDEYFISDWVGHVSIVSKSKQRVQILDLASSKVNAADIWYVPSKKLLLVPTFYDNRILAYEYKFR
jgi:hypothetical protein